MSEKPPELLKIGAISKATGLAVSALRYYEELGLLIPEYKNDSKYRFYKNSDISLVNFIMKSKRLGFSLEEIKSILAERKQGKSPCSRVRQFAKSKINELQMQIKELQNLEAELKNFIINASSDIESQFGEAKVCGLIENAEV